MNTHKRFNTLIISLLLIALLTGPTVTLARAVEPPPRPATQGETPGVTPRTYLPVETERQPDPPAPETGERPTVTLSDSPTLGTLPLAKQETAPRTQSAPPSTRAPWAATAATHVYTDATGLSNLDSYSCTAPAILTLTVPITFTVGDVDVGVNLGHTRRGHISATLQSPAGTRISLIQDPDSADNSDNYDVRVDDISPNPRDDGDSDDTAVPYYERTVAPPVLFAQGDGLATFEGENAWGNWRLLICDTTPGSGDGDLNQWTLFFSEPEPKFDRLSYKGASYKIEPGEVLTYSIIVINSGTVMSGTHTLISDTLPAGVVQRDPATFIPFDSATIVSQATNPVTWQGTITSPGQIIILIPVTATLAAGHTITNTTFITDPGLASEIQLPATTRVYPAGTLYYYENFNTHATSTSDPQSGAGPNWSSQGDWDASNLPFIGPLTAHSGLIAAGTNIYGPYDDATTSVLTGVLDLTGVPLTNSVELQWWEWLDTQECCDEAMVQIASTAHPTPILLRGQAGGGLTDEQMAHERAWTEIVHSITPYRGQVVTLTFTLQPNGDGSTSAGWYVDDVAVHLLPGMPEFITSKTVYPDRVLAGEPLTYTIRITNSGSLSSTDGRLYDPLPAGLVLNSATLDGSGLFDSGPDFVEWRTTPGNPLQVDEAITITIVATATDSLACNTTLVNTALLTDSLAPEDTLITAPPVVFGPYWLQASPVPTTTRDNAVIEYNQQAYLFAGRGGAGGMPLTLTARYSPTIDAWFTLAPQPEPSLRPSDACFGHNAADDPVVVLFPDATGALTNTLRIYDIAGDAWYTDTLPDPLPDEGIWAPDIVSDRDNNRCYISGGSDDSMFGAGNLATLYEYDVGANTAISLPQMTTSRNHHASWLYDGMVCVGGGNHNSYQVLTSTQCYDISGGAWLDEDATLGPLPYGNWGMADALKVEEGVAQLWIVAGVNANHNITETTAHWDADIQTWTLDAPLPNPVYRFEATVLQGDVYAFGGDGYSGFTDANQHHLQCQGPPPETADLSLTKIGSPHLAALGSPLVYTITVANGGPYTATDLLLVDTLPPEVTFDQASPGCAATDGTVTCDLGALADGAAVSVTIEGTVSSGSRNVITNSATVTGSIADPNPLDNADVATTTLIVTAWDKQVFINGELSDVAPGLIVSATDTVEIIDRLWLTYTGPVTFSLVEAWTESLSLTHWLSNTGQVTRANSTLTWEIPAAVPHTWHVLTKTFTVVSGTFSADYVTETLTPEGMPPQERVLEFLYFTPGGIPDIDVSPSALAATVPAGGTANRSLTIGNSGTNPLTWEITANPPAAWLSATPTLGGVAAGDTKPVAVDLDAAGLSAGTYTTSLQVASNDPDESVVTVPVTLTVTLLPIQWDKQVLLNGAPVDPAAGVVVSPTDSVEIVDRVWITHTDPVTFDLVEAWTESLSLTHWSNSSGTVADTSDTLTWQVPDAAPDTWHVLTKTFAVVSGTFGADYVTETLTVSGRDPEQRVLEFLYFTPGGTPDIDVSPAALTATLQADATTSRTLTIHNVGDNPLQWSLAENPAVDWLDQQSILGGVPGGGADQVTINFDAAGLGTGDHATRLEISSNDPDESLVSVPVTLTIETSCVAISGADFYFQPANPHMGEPVVFEGTVVSGSPVSYTWDLGDGDTASGQIVTHTFPGALTPQSYTVVMTAANSCSEQAVNKLVTLTPTTLYLPITLKNYCPAFPYNETIRYNLDIINAPEAWRCQPGGGTVVAVLDTGTDLDHPDLQDNLVGGATFVSGTSSPNDDQGHGSHVSGIVAGVANNGGIVGVAPSASIMPVKVLDYQGSGYTSWVANGVIWAVDHGARVINLSLGGIYNSSTLGDAINYAHNRGALIVAAAGNCGDQWYSLNGCNYQDQTNYPGALSNVMAVASTTSSDQQSSFSNEGWYVEIAAPGSSIYSSIPGGGYDTHSGTSQATPHVAGLAALIWTENPGWTNEQVRARIQNTAIDLGNSGWDSQFGYGRINAAAALESALANAGWEGQARPTDEPAEQGQNAGPAFASGRILLKLQPGYNLAGVLAQAQVRSTDVHTLQTLHQLGVVSLAVPEGQEEAIVTQLSNVEGVEYAELDYLMTAQ